MRHTIMLPGRATDLRPTAEIPGDRIGSPPPKVILQGLTCDRAGCSCHFAALYGRGTTHCPAHRDRDPSLEVGAGPSGLTLVKCYGKRTVNGRRRSTCSLRQVIDALWDVGLWPRPATPGSLRGRRKETEDAVERLWADLDYVCEMVSAGGYGLRQLSEPLQEDPAAPSSHRAA